MTTPDNITELGPNEILVFGSNLEGNHAGGAARDAHEKFGAVWGKGVGIQGQSYAIPTMGDIKQIEMYAKDFIEYAETHPDKTFYLTKIGCGIAGYSEDEIKPLFKYMPSNVARPEGW